MESKRKKKTGIVWICIAAVVLTAAVLLCVHYRGLKPFLSVELGASLPDISVVAPEVDRYAQDYGTLDGGLHVIRIIHHNLPTPVLVRVRDTTAPTAEPKARTIAYGQTLTPDKLVAHIRDADIVAVTFAEPFDFDRIGTFDVTVRLKDASGNASEVGSTLTIAATVDRIALEAGDPLPKIGDFLLAGVEAQPQTTLEEAQMHRVGTVPVRFLLKNGQIAESELVVADTTPPTGESTFLWVKPDEPFTPEMLVEDPADETPLTFAFLEEPDATLLHAQSVTVRMTDAGGNTTDVVSTLAISHVAPITAEASKEPLAGDVFGETEGIALTEPFVPDTPGLYSIPVTVDGEPDYALITVTDTTAPVLARTEGTRAYTLHPSTPDALYTADDLSPVTMEWIEEPDWNAAGEQAVRIRAVDRFGNETTLADALTLEPDTEPPVLYGVVNRTAYVGEPIAYFAEVYAEDAVDGHTEVAVQSEVLPDREGSYKVVYTSEDRSGNRVSAECTYKLVNATVSEDEVRALAQEVLEKIITDDMVTAEKLKAVFDYVRKHVSYVGNSDKTDWRKEARRGFTTGKGDCFTFYAVTRALLDELGIDYMSVTRKGSSTRHYWVIVNIGTGWYHFDPILAPRHKHKCFMWTNRQCQVKPYFWRYEKANYPEIATDPFDYDAVVRAEREGRLP